MKRWLPLCAAFLAAGCGGDSRRENASAERAGRIEEGAPSAARAELVNAKGEAVGTATFEPMKPSGVRIRLDLRNLPPGEHAIHIHERAVCDPPKFEAAGAHFAPDRREHGLRNPKGPHAGDLPNITVGKDGRVKAVLENPRVTLGPGPASLLSGDGTALVIHARADDHRTDPSGGSGDRIACGPIRRVEPEAE